MKSVSTVSEAGDPSHTRCIAFEGQRLIASGPILEVVQKAKEAVDRGGPHAVLLFNEKTSELIEVDFRGTEAEVLERLASARAVGSAPETPGILQKRGPGRPKLGVVAREVTLLPRHWTWLDSQPGGASVAMRKLVEAASRTHQGQDRARRSAEAVHRFMWALAGDLPGFEEASRAFYRKDQDRFSALTEPWPVDLRDHLRKLAATAFRDEATANAPSSQMARQP